MCLFLPRSIVLFVTFAVLLLWIPPAVHAQNAQPEVVGTTNSMQARPRTDGQYVVWVQLRSGIDEISESAYYDLYASDLGSRTQQRQTV
jgi:hypothetical protein